MKQEMRETVNDTCCRFTACELRNRHPVCLQSSYRTHEYPVIYSVPYVSLRKRHILLGWVVSCTKSQLCLSYTSHSVMSRLCGSTGLWEGVSQGSLGARGCIETYCMHGWGLRNHSELS